MVLENARLLSQAAGYLVTVILSLCLLIPMVMNEANFKGHCLLFASGEFETRDGSFDAKWGSNFYCGFTLFVGIASLTTAFVQMVRMAIFLYKSTDSSFLSAFLDSIVACLLVIFVITSAVFVTRGFSQWCTCVTERFPSCEDASSFMKIKDMPEVETSGFYLTMQTVQFGVWTSLVAWVTLLVLAARKLFVYHERENIIVTMARERSRYSGRSYNSVESDE